MVTIRPTYSPVDKLWFTDDGITARSIRELLEQLPPGTEIADYFPGGHGDTVKPRAPGLVKWGSRYDPPRRGRPPTRYVRDESPVVPELPAPAPEDPVELDVELDAVEFVKPKKPEPERKVIPDPEPLPPAPVKRYAAPVPIRRQPVERKKVDPTDMVDWKDSATFNRLKILVESGLSATDIADRMGCSRNAVIGACGRNKLRLRGKRRG